MKSTRVLVNVLSVSLLCICLPAVGSGYPETFEEVSGYPPVTGSVVADVLGDGRFIIYEGNGTSGGNIHIEDAAGSETFSMVATGYQGDPGFIAVAPDGHTCLIGAGAVDWLGDPANDWVWLFDANDPADAPALHPISGYVSDGLALISNNYWGVWLDDHLVLVEGSDASWMGEIVILDVNTAACRKVVAKGQYSSSIVLGQGQTAGYAFSTVGFGDSGGETRAFPVQDLIDVFNNPAYDPATSPLSWTDGTVLGTYPDFGPGPSAVGDRGTLVFGGHTGEILYVDADSGEPLGKAINVPSGGSGSVRPYYNPVTRKMLVTETDWAAFSFTGYISTEPFTDIRPLRLTAPNGGEFMPGHKCPIAWDTGNGGDVGSHVRLALHNGFAFHSWIDRQVDNNGAWFWLIPDLPTGVNYRIRVQSFDNRSVRDYSDMPFAITLEQPLVVTWPNGGEQLVTGHEYTLTWQTNSPAAGDDVRVGLHLGATFLEWIARRTENDGTFPFVIPYDIPEAANYRLRVQSFSNRAIRDFSDGFVTIEQDRTDTRAQTLPVYHRVGR